MELKDNNKEYAKAHEFFDEFNRRKKPALRLIKAGEV